MCYREVKCVKHACGHGTPMSDQRVDCGSARCRYSSSHDASCANCTATCVQWLRPAKTIITHQSSSPCSSCR
ncbi:hypothetical protein AN958_03334 [Leucoagaricus sp. SymC.cos]|nr:hypothetical protein AN958_03334 [Leucoagaricus sp. SymC.cos]